MITIFFYSIAGLSQDAKIDESLENLISLDCISDSDKKIAKHCLTCSENGNYPSVEYFDTIYKNRPVVTYNTIGEILTHYSAMVDYYQRQALQRTITTDINETSTFGDLLSRLTKRINDTENSNDEEFDFSEYEPVLYGDEEDKPLEEGLLLGVEEIDKITHGFQRGCVASICGFTGHGKSTLCNSSVYTNVMRGKKSLIISLELAPELYWKYIETRYMFDEKQLNVSLDEMQQHTLSPNLRDCVKAFEDDFRRDVKTNLLIIDENMLNKKLLLDFRKLNKLFKAAEKKLGGLDLVVLDHVGQLERLFPDMGNNMLKQLTSAAKTYKNEKGEKVGMIWAVQCNREGVRRASRREGQYDLLAIGDLNEVERSSSYCVFLYTSDSMKITQETKISLLKNRLGVPIPVPFKTSFTPNVVAIGKKFDNAVLNNDDFSFTENFDDLPEDLPLEF